MKMNLKLFAKRHSFIARCRTHCSQTAIEIWNWLSEYYLCNIGEIYRFAFPSSLKLESETYLKRNQNKEITKFDANETYLLQALK